MQTWAVVCVSFLVNGANWIHPKGSPVPLVEKQHLGGICLNWGCIHTKALLKGAGMTKTELIRGPLALQCPYLLGLLIPGTDPEFSGS